MMGWAGPGLETYTECHARLQQNVRPGFEPFVECQALGLEIILSKAVKKLKFFGPLQNARPFRLGPFSKSGSGPFKKNSPRIGLSRA